MSTSANAAILLGGTLSLLGGLASAWSATHIRRQAAGLPSPAAVQAPAVTSVSACPSPLPTTVVASSSPPRPRAPPPSPCTPVGVVSPCTQAAGDATDAADATIAPVCRPIIAYIVREPGLRELLLALGVTPVLLEDGTSSDDGATTAQHSPTCEGERRYVIAGDSTQPLSTTAAYAALHWYRLTGAPIPRDWNMLPALVPMHPEFPRKNRLPYVNTLALLRVPAVTDVIMDFFRHAVTTTNANIIVAFETRAMAFGTMVAQVCRLPFVPARKTGDMPGAAILVSGPVKAHTYRAEQRICLDGYELTQDDRVCIVEDVICTGATVLAMHELVKKAGARVVCTASVIKICADDVEADDGCTDTDTGTDADAGAATDTNSDTDSEPADGAVHVLITHRCSASSNVVAMAAT